MDELLYLCSEFLGTFLLILIGLSVNANVSLKKTSGNNSGWIVICWGWAMGVLFGATVASYSGGQINPAVTLSLWATTQISWSDTLLALVGQFAGAFLAALLVVYLYWDHFKATQDGKKIGGTFFTGDQEKSVTKNFFAEITATFVLVLGILVTSIYSESFNMYVPLFAALLVFGIGLSLGGLSGFAINPARDLMPRLVHSIIKVPNKTNSYWGYAWVPIVAPILGGLLACVITYLGLAIADTSWGDILSQGSFIN